MVKRLFNFYIFSNLHVAVAAFSLTYLTLLSIDETNITLPLLVFFATVLSYNLIRFYGIERINPFSYHFIKKNKLLLIVLTLISAVSTGYLFLQLNTNSMIFLLPFMGFTLFYFLPIKWRGKRITLRKISMLKIFLIGFSWASVTYILPIIQFEQQIDLTVWVNYFQRLLFLIVIILPFDIRDMSTDEDHLKTLPQQYGEIKVKRMGLLLMMIFLGLEFVSAEPKSLQVHLIVALATLFLLFKATREQHKFYSAFWVESLPILWFIVYLLLIFKP